MIIKTSYSFMKPPPSARLIRGHRLAQGLVGLWLFNEGSGNKVFDLSGNGNTGVFNGTPTWVSGDKGSAINFLGSADFINCGNGLSLDITGEITIISSFKATDTGYNRTIIGKQGKDAYWFLIFEDKLQFFAGEPVASLSSVLLFDNTRVQVAVTRNDAKDRTSFYFDGVHDITNDIGGNMVSFPSNNVYIGVDPRDEVGTDFIGDIDYVMIYNRALLASEIALLFLKPFGMFERKARTALLSGYEVIAPPVGMAGAMTTNTGYWGW